MTERRIAYALAYMIAATSAILASLYGFMSASGYYGIAKGAGLCLVALIGCHGPAWTVRLKREMGSAAAAFGGLVTAACFAVTLLGGIGTVSSGTATMLADQSKLADDVSRDRGELERLTAERAAMRFQSTDEAGVQAARNTAEIARRIRETECASGRGSRCRDKEAEELAAQQALTAALGNQTTTDRAAKLDDEIEALRKGLDGAPAAVASDPQASAFSQLTGLEINTAAALYAFLFSVALELAAMFALLVAHSHSVAELGITEPEAAPAPAAAAALASRVSVARFMLSCLPRQDGGQVEARQVYFRFVRWCGEQSPALRPLEPLPFAEEFKALCGRGNISIRHDGERAYCDGVRLVS